MANKSSKQETRGLFTTKKVSLFIAIVIVGGLGWLFKFIDVKDKCASEVTYVPAKQSINSDNGFVAKQGEDAHYLWGAKKFESKKEAMERCVREQ